MGKHITKIGLLKILIIAAVTGVVLFGGGVLWIRIFPAPQERNIKLADSHAKILQPLLANQKRYKDIQVTHYTGDGGTLLVIGVLATEQDKTDLERIVTDSKPPVKVTFMVHMRGQEPAIMWNK